MDKITERLAAARLVPVVKIENVEDALPLAQALTEGGLPLAEITFRTPAAEEAIRLIKREFPQMLVGAGTLLCPEQVERARNAGAEFFVSPGLNENTAEYCQKENIPFMPGVMTPSDIEKALSLGLSYLKFFPAESAGGTAMLKALSAPYGGVKFMPTGGISLENLADYLALPSVFACGGSFMVSGNLISSGDFDGITEICKKAVEILGGIKA